ncbi:mechanosensitive ion channel protein MscS [Loktanella sp. 3ANDIMAR09]|uniref:mechanosensitive ion channel domain-containing protein n=1 Tax=Loktanella sp. 3ANDIMAR09 TaxID=1225657 RepID=UPI0006F7D264|nr:mechanosensitive ion channel domain-containing protein [Loktanella sp. 3ANDIMAR09]KQI68159.1 mechanosensitive ion channel protein MscS [Loktanella sp. 3ANDIMAR09]
MRAFILIILLLWPVAAVAQDNAAPIATETSARDDTAIRSRISDIIAVLGGYESVDVAVQEGVVTLTGEVLTPQDQTALTELAQRIEGVIAVRNNTVETTDLDARLTPALERFRTRALQLVSSLPLLGIALVVFIVIVWVGLALARWQRPWKRLAPNAFIAQIMQQIIRLAFVVLGLVVALDILGATALLGTILGAAGIIGLALGFAVKDTVENFIASIMLSIRQPFAPNDVVEINGDIGTVIRLTSRATILLSPDGNHIRIPNATVFSSRVVNYTQNAERRFLFPISVSRDCDLAAARSLIERTVQDLPFVLDQPRAAVWIETLEAGGVVMQVAGWIDQRRSSLPLAQGEAIRHVKRALEEDGFEIPDNVQPIALTRAPSDPSPAHSKESADIAEVSPGQEEAVSDMIKAERNREDTPDLLRADGQKE